MKRFPVSDLCDGQCFFNSPRRLQSAEHELAERSSYDYVIHSGTKEQDFRSLLAYWEQARRKLAP